MENLPRALDRVIELIDDRRAGGHEGKARKVILQAKQRGVLPQQPGAESVKRPHPYAVDAGQTLDALTHFLGSFVGEGDGENIPRLDVLFCDQISDAMRDDPCFTRACAGEEQKRTFCVKYGLPLLFVELRKKIRFHYLINP